MRMAVMVPARLVIGGFLFATGVGLRLGNLSG